MKNIIIIIKIMILPFLKKYKNIHKKIPDNIRDREIKDLIKLSNKLDFNDQK